LNNFFGHIGTYIPSSAVPLELRAIFYTFKPYLKCSVSLYREVTLTRKAVTESRTLHG